MQLIMTKSFALFASAVVCMGTVAAGAAPKKTPIADATTIDPYYKVPVGTAIFSPAVALAIGVAVAAIVVTQIVLRVRWAVAQTSTTHQVATVSVLQRDDALEDSRVASAQLHPFGACVRTTTHGDVVVRSYDAATQTYDVVPTTSGSSNDTASITLAADAIETPHVVDLVVYPIKSCAGVRLSTAMITQKGIANDRSWMFTDASGKFITQRRYHKMALITPTLLPTIEHPTSILLTAPGMDDLNVPILRTGGKQSVTVWKSTMSAIDQGDAAAAWINTFLSDVRGDRALRFVRVDDAFDRTVDAKYAPNHTTGFADGFPFLLALVTSLTELNASLEHAIPINRFRPNIVLAGAPAFADEHWNCITINGIRFRNVKPCSRCNLPCVDQATGISDVNREPAKTLARLRNGDVLGFTGATKHDNYFGSNLVAESGGTIDVGARVKVLTLKHEVIA